VNAIDREQEGMDREAEAEQVRRAQAGDREAFVGLVERHLLGLYRFVARELRYHEALGTLPPGEVAVEDIADEVFLTALRDLHRMPSRASLKGWLRYLALRAVRRAVRRSRLRRQYEGLHLEDPLPAGRLFDDGDPEPSRTWKEVMPDRSLPLPQEVIEFKETWQTLESALQQLPADQRQVFIWRAIEGLRYAEIAALLGHPLPEVKATYRAARAALRLRLAEGLGAPTAAEHASAREGA
jgi:RNA polymerase sigma factor (sigma-70 family)